MFRGKESSNRIELSRLVQDLLNFGVLGSLRLWGWGGWVDGGGGVIEGCPHTCVHARACTHAHACTCMRGKHDNSMQMAAPIRFGEIPGIPYDVIRACACMRACARVWGDPVTTPIHPPPHPTSPIHPPPHPPPPSTHLPTPQGGGPPGISQNSIALELIEIFQFCLKI